MCVWVQDALPKDSHDMEAKELSLLWVDVGRGATKYILAVKWGFPTKP